MGIGAMIVRGAAIIGGGALLYTTVLNPLMDGISGSNAVVEQGYVSPKSLSVQGKKNAAGNIEAYLQYKNGEEVISLPCRKGPSGPLCGAVDYWWNSIGRDSRTGLVASEWPSVDSQVKRDIVGSELDSMLENFYGSQSQKQIPVKNPVQQLQQQYKAQQAKQK